MKILYITTVGSTMYFFKSFIRGLLDKGNIVDIATNEKEAKVQDYYREWGCKVFQISCSRSLARKGNYEAIKQINKIVNNGKYNIVHCHTPIAAACTRLACKNLRKKGVKVIYTAHGFHFYTGAPIKNWLIYYPVEKICAHWTDVLITINTEDYFRAKKKIRAKRVEYISGVGIDIKKFTEAVVDRDAKRTEIEVPKDAFLLLSIGELNDNKNHEAVIRAIAKFKNENIYYIIVGNGYLKKRLQTTVKELGIERKVRLLGIRNDVVELYKSADLYILPSIREGLNVSVMEALASGLPVICSKIRGNVDLVEDGVTGYFVNPLEVNTFGMTISNIKDHPLNFQACVDSSKKYDVQKINCQLYSLYLNLLDEDKK